MICLILSVYILFSHFSTAEIYSSTAHIKQELERIRQDKCIEMIKKLVDKNDSDSTNMNRLIGTLDELEAGSKNPNYTVHHPLDAYRFIRNRSIIYSETVTSLFNELQRNNNDHVEIGKLAKNLIALSKDDLLGALKGLIRIQHIYDIKTQELADGNVLGQYRRKMTAVECKDLMTVAFYSDLINLALDWLEVAMHKIDLGDDTISLTKLLCKAVAAAYDVKQEDSAAIFLEYILEQNPKNRYLRHKMKYYQRHIKHNVFKLVKYSNNFRSSCQKSIYQDYKTIIRKDLFCSYVDNDHPFLRYQPGKVEILSSDPMILIYHDAFTSNTLSTLMEPIKQYLYRSQVSVNSTHYSSSEQRTSKGVDFGSDGLPTKLYEYVGALTALRWETFENFQITNYGIGGHYDIHHDSFHPGEIESELLPSNRIATFMIYFTDVEKGGATVFPKAEVSVLPKAGNAVFWYNLKPDGSPRDETIHAACPVIIGDKYIGNIWIPERGQEFTRPCKIDQKDTKHKWPFTNN